MNCPNCHADALTIVRGVRPYCMACGAPRPLSTTSDSVNMAGRPAKLGGRIAGVLGVGALAAGVLVACVLGIIANLIFSLATALWVGGAIVFLTALIALPLMFGGRRLYRSGEDRARAAQEEAVFALATRHRGMLTARDLARALSLREEDADTLLTDLAKRPDGRVTVEVDDSGVISYVFGDLLADPRGRVRISDQPRWTPARIPEAAAPPQIIDAEIVDEVSPPGARHASR